MTKFMYDADATNGGGGAPEEKGGDGKKIKVRFENNIGKLSAILGKEPEKRAKKKVAGSEVENIVKAMFQEDQEAVIAEVKVDLKGLLVDYVKMNQEIENKEKELEKLKLLKMKEFCEASDKLFNKIEGLPLLEKKYQDALVAMSTPPPASGA